MTVLIVDNNAAMRAMIRSLLTGRKYRCHECSDGESALTQSDVIRPNIVLMDIAMVPMDGLMTTKLLKERHPEVKVIMVTDHGDRRTRAAARAVGADGFLRKEDLLALEKEVWRISQGISHAPITGPTSSL